jgi:hypothetical protein
MDIDDDEAESVMVIRRRSPMLIFLLFYCVIYDP